jgi:MinD-like ATPase involved in chromosome partitioning or flagellar assembly
MGTPGLSSAWDQTDWVNRLIEEPCNAMELIAFASGKGGTGKTLMASCLGYALVRAGQRVLMIDADPATDGLSLFLLGPSGMNQISDFQEANTFTGILQQCQSSNVLKVEPRRINRGGAGNAIDHGISYEAIISGKGLYGDVSARIQAIPVLNRQEFQRAITSLFSKIREKNQYDYVLVDTRGGFAFESTDVCALADSFIVVTDPDVTSYYQDRNLVKHISRAAQELGSATVLRSIIVNRATEGQDTDQLDLSKLEVSFRLQLETEFPVKFNDTHPVPADLEVLRAYKTQKVPYLVAPASLFSFATLSAFGEILKVVTAKWTSEQVQRWNSLVGSVSEAIDKRNKEHIAERESRAASAEQLAVLRRVNAEQKEKISNLEKEIDRLDDRYRRELAGKDKNDELMRREIARLTERYEAEFSRKERLEDSIRAEVMRRENDYRTTLAQLEALVTAQREEKALKPRHSMIQRIAEMNKVMLALLLSVTLIALFVAGFWAYRSFVNGEQQRREQRIETMLKDLYNPSLPSSLRVKYLSDLIQMNQQNFDGLQFFQGDLRGISGVHLSFRNAVLNGVDLSNGNLILADFSNGDLQVVNFKGTDLAGANFEGANLKGANFEGANLKGANFAGANLALATISDMQLKEALVDSKTVLPKGSDIVPHLPTTN